MHWRPDSVEAESNHQQIAGNWFFNFLLWRTHHLGCSCRSNSCKQWRREETKRALARVQGLYVKLWLPTIYSTMKLQSAPHKALMARHNWPSTPFSCRTLQRQKGSHIILFWDRQNTQKDLCHISKISQTLKKKLNTTVKSWSSNQRLYMIEKWKKKHDSMVWCLIEKPVLRIQEKLWLSKKRNGNYNTLLISCILLTQLSRIKK